MQFRVRNFEWIPRSWVCDSLSFQSKGHNQQCAQRSCLVFARGRTTIKRNARVRVPSIVFLTASLSSKYFKASPNRHCLGNADTTTFNTVAKRRWHQAKHDLWSILLLTASRLANKVLWKFENMQFSGVFYVALVRFLEMRCLNGAKQSF